MKVKVLKGTVFVFATLFMGALLFTAPELCDVVSVFYIALVGTFVGMDLIAMIQKTKSLPQGQFDKIDAWRYIMSYVTIGLLLVIAFLKKSPTVTLTATIVSFSSSILIISSMLIAGLDGNRILTDAGDKKE